jgi:hypothetical protein
VELLLRARMRRPAGHQTRPAKILWNREHLELFLKPFADRPGMLQCGVDSRGESSTLWHGCEAPAGCAVTCHVEETDCGWQCEIRIPLEAIVAHIAPGETPEWRYLAGFATAAHRNDAAYWRETGHDPEGVFADPLFVDPANGDFRLRPDSPAFEMGFVPWAFEQAGPRGDLSPTQRNRK